MILDLVQRLPSVESQTQTTCTTHSTARTVTLKGLSVGEYSEVPWIYMQTFNECGKSFFYLRDSVSLKETLLQQKQR
jgi:hypothetical protein